MLTGSKTGLSDLPLDSTRNLPATRYVIERYTRPTTPPTDRETPSCIPSILPNQTKPKSPSTPPTAWHSKRKCTSTTTTAHTLSWGAAALQVDKYLPTYLSISRGCSNVWRMLMVPKGRTRGLEKRGVRVTTLALLLLYTCYYFSDVVAPFLASQHSKREVSKR
jgi:hypothetical protein